jgi:anti-anti-sigma factor
VLKTRVANGQLAAAEVILSCPSVAAGMPIAQLLASQRGWGEARSRAFLAEVGVREDKSLGSLTERQRQAAASLLRADHRVPRLDPHPASWLPSAEYLPFAIRESEEDGGTRLTLTGKLDVTTAPALRNRLNQSRRDWRDVRLDLSRLEVIDCAGINVLIQAVNDARSDGLRLEVEGNLSPQVKLVAELTHRRGAFT